MKSISKYISLILRHKPEVIGITLDEHGWAKVDELLEGVSKTHALSRAELEVIVREDEKQRYSFNADRSKIRANQGHSIQVDVELEEKEPPAVLYHGSAEKYAASIAQSGLLPKNRLYVHLSSDEATAVKVGSRHGKPIVYRIRCDEMIQDGYTFYYSKNGIWLVGNVPYRYMERIQ